MKLRLIIFKCFSAKSTTIHDLDNIFTKNVTNVTQYVNVVTNVNLVTVKKVLHPLVKDCQFGVSPVNYSDSDSDQITLKEIDS